MIARASNAKSRVEWECVGPSPCERSDGCTTTSTNFPATACAELEVSFVFPSCWDGVNLVSETMTSHVSYDDSEAGQFDGDCPASHPVKLPEIHLYFRIQDYPGGQHVFSDGSDIYHADYFSGWNETELQRVLDECSNDSDAASPDAFCEDFLTYRDGNKTTGVQKEDDNIRGTLEPLQPTPSLRPQLTVTTEAITNISTLPRTPCTGTLLPPTAQSQPSLPPSLPTPADSGSPPSQPPPANAASPPSPPPPATAGSAPSSPASPTPLVSAEGSSESSCGGGCVGGIVGGAFVPVLLLALWLGGAFGSKCPSPCSRVQAKEVGGHGATATWKAENV